jgi:hypothetical protein
MYLYDQTDMPKSYSIGFAREPDVTKLYFGQTYTSYFKTLNGGDIVLKEFTVNELLVKSPEYYEEMYSEQLVTASKTRIVRVVKSYQYSDCYYFYYDLYKDYSEEYLNGPNEDYYIKETLFYKDYYRFQTRDKLVLNYPLKIVSSNQTIDEFVTYSSNPYIINSNINYKKNGIYNITFNINNNVIEELVEVNIPKKKVIRIKEEAKTEPVIETKEIKEETKTQKDKEVLKMFLIPSLLLMTSPMLIYFKSQYDN